MLLSQATSKGASYTWTSSCGACWHRHPESRRHELITSGPYAIVRHPIYTGLLFAFAGSAIARAERRGVLALVIVFLALWRKLRFEEHWMREQFGQRYETYSRRVAALIPYLL